MNKPIIEFRNFTYHYETAQTPALSDLTFQISEGDFVGIVGPNKAGKSSLCLSMAGILPYTFGGSYAGSIIVAGEDYEQTGAASAVSHVGIVFQDAESQFTQETVEDEIAFSMCNLGYPRALMQQRMQDAVSACHLEELLTRSPFALSGGQQQRLAVACMLALQPDIIILDESTSQLDPIGRDEVFTLAAELHAKGKTIIMVDHNVEKIAEYAATMIVMNEGRMTHIGPKHEIIRALSEKKPHGLRIPQVSEAAVRMNDVVPCKDIPIVLDEAVQHFKTLRKENA